MAEVVAGGESGASRQPTEHGDDDVAVQIGSQHDVELVGAGDQLHGTVVHDHRVELYLGVRLRHLSAALQEQTVSLLPKLQSQQINTSKPQPNIELT